MLVEEGKVDKETYDKLSMNQNLPIDGDMCWVENRKIKMDKGTDCDKYKFSGCMSSSAKGQLEIHITEETGPD